MSRFFGVGVAGEGRSGHRHLAAVGGDQAGNHRDGRALAGAVGAEQPDQLPRLDRKRHAVDGEDGASVGLAEVPDRQHVLVDVRERTGVPQAAACGIGCAPLGDN